MWGLDFKKVVLAKIWGEGQTISINLKKGFREIFGGNAAEKWGDLSGC